MEDTIVNSFDKFVGYPAKNKVSTKFKALEMFTEDENNPIVYYNGNYYWIGEDSEIPKDFNIEDGKIETGNPVIRNVINVGHYVPDTPYSSEWVQGKAFTHGYSEDAEGYLPDSKKRYYKEVNGIDAHHILHNTKFGSVCIRNQCSSCEYYDKCNPIIHKVVDNPRIFDIVVLDISAQEPMIMTYFTGETAMLEGFRNRHLRNAGMLVYIDLIYREYFQKDPNKVESYQYWEWIDNNFHHRPQDLIAFNTAVDMLRAGNTTVNDFISAQTQKWVSSIDTYIKSKDTTVGAL